MGWVRFVALACSGEGTVWLVAMARNALAWLVALVRIERAWIGLSRRLGEA